MSTIICATDLSSFRVEVSAVAAALAHSMHARLELLHVAHVSPGLPPELMGEGLQRNVRAAALDLLRERAGELTATGLEVEPCVRLGLADDEIDARVRETGAELLVLGTHARRGAARFFMGSVAERLVRAAPCPTVVVPRGYEGELVRGRRPERPLRLTAGMDASPASEAALAWLHRIAQRTPCALRLVSFYWPPREHERLGLDPPAPFEADPEVVTILARELRSHVRAHFGAEEIPLRIRPTWGAETDPLAAEAEADQADLLVIGVGDGRRSPAVHTVRTSRLPVVCVPRLPAEAAAPRLAPVRVVLVTTDFSPAGNAAVPHAYRLLARGGGRVVLVHVAEGARGGALEGGRRDDVEQRLRALVPAGVDVHAIETETVAAVAPSAGDGILRTIRQAEPDVVVMASHGHTGLRRAVQGSVTEQVVRASPRPILVVPPDDRRW